MRGLWTVLLTTVVTGMATAGTNFAKDEVDKIRRFWIEPGRYTTSAPESASRVGKWQVRLTVEGSEWIWRYYRARGYGKVNPSTDALSIKDPMDTWVEQRVAYDRWLAAKEANQKNALETGIPLPELSPEPMNPGAPSAEIVALAGEAPSFANIVVPKQYEIKFPDGKTLRYVDNVDMRPKYAYYRFSQGVQSAGVAVKSMSDAALTELFTAAKVNQSIMRVMRAVSMLEGGFDSVNTYDTGFLSVGVIQFATLKAGAGSLGGVLSRLKKNDPVAFKTAFHNFGIEVAKNNAIVSLDLVTGEELVGPAAVQNIIDDKRLVAVFQYAGLTSKPFCVAQIQVARDRYYPADDVVSVATPSGKQVTAKVFEIVRSEAAMATLMDRKVNTGKIDPFQKVVQEMVTSYELDDPRKLTEYESELVARVKYRKNYLQDPGLSQPKPSLTTPTGSTSRGGTKRAGRNGGKKK